MKELVRQPNQRQKRAMELFLYYLERQTKNSIAPPSMGKIMREAGYSDLTSKSPHTLTRSEVWKEFLNEIDDTLIVKKWKQWALEDDPSLRNSALKAGENIMKLKDRYPTQKTQHGHIHADLKDIYD